MNDVTALIITKNEEKNIEDCIKSIIGFCSRILVIDSYSTDNTIAICKKYKCDCYFHEFITHADQRNWALDNCDISTKWVLRLDADERLTPILCKELEKMIIVHDNDDVNGITMEASLYFLGKRIKHGCKNKRKLMLFKYGFARIENRRMDEHTILLKGTSVSCKNKFIHYDFKSIDSWISKLNWYATNEVLDYYDTLCNPKTNNMNIENDKEISKNRKKKFGFYYKLPLFIRCWMLFIYNYIFRLGFLDGKEGFVYHWMYHRWYRTLVDSKILEKRIADKKELK